MRSEWRFLRAVREEPGTTGMQVGEIVDALGRASLRTESPCFWPAIRSETTTELPDRLPPGYYFEPVAEPLSGLYQSRHGLDIPREIRDLPSQTWADTTYGGGKRPVSAGICYSLHRAELARKRNAAWIALAPNSPEVMADLRAVRRHHPDARWSGEPPMVLLTAAADGSTGHAGIISALDHWLPHADEPLCAVVLVRCGATNDGRLTENANYARLALSLQERAIAHPGRLWVFVFNDDDERHRPTLLREAGEFIFEWLATAWGADLRRLLVDTFVAAGARPDGGPPSFLCAVDAVRIEIVPESERLRRTLMLATNAVLKEVTR